MIHLLEQLHTHRHRTALRSKMAKHRILTRYREKKQLDINEIDIPALEALYWELKITLQHRVFSRDSLEESLDSSILQLEHQIQHISEKLHSLGHNEFECPHDCPTDTTIRAENYYHPRCQHCSTSMVPQKL